MSLSSGATGMKRWSASSTKRISIGPTSWRIGLRVYTSAILPIAPSSVAEKNIV